MTERALTKEKILLTFPPKREIAYPRPGRVKEGILPLEFMVSRNEQGTIIYAINAGHYEDPTQSAH